MVQIWRLLDVDGYTMKSINSLKMFEPPPLGWFTRSPHHGWQKCPPIWGNPWCCKPQRHGNRHDSTCLRKTVKIETKETRIQKIRLRKLSPQLWIDGLDRWLDCFTSPADVNLGWAHELLGHHWGGTQLLRQGLRSQCFMFKGSKVWQCLTGVSKSINPLAISKIQIRRNWCCRSPTRDPWGNSLGCSLFTTFTQCFLPRGQGRKRQQGPQWRRQCLRDETAARHV